MGAMARTRPKERLNALKPGYQFHWYQIRDVLGQGGFGITYLAQDLNLSHEVAIKEYFPIDLATRKGDSSVRTLSEEHSEKYHWGLERFIEEARTLGQFRHPNIVRVRNVFAANNTAYMIMDYELGETLQDILNRRKTLDEEDLLGIVFPIMDGLIMVHAAGFIHRDIKPANIFIRVDGEPVLLDFGSARRALEENRQSFTSVFSRGYTPIEQYDTSEEQQGPWTDIYSLGATMYRAVSGVAPSDAVDRSRALSHGVADTYLSAMEFAGGRYSNALLAAIDAALRFKRQDRPQTVSEWRALFADLDARVARRPLAHVPAVKDSGAVSEEELENYRKAAERGNVGAQIMLASACAGDAGRPSNVAEALQWYLRAAQAGDTGAQAALGYMYVKGIGTIPDESQGFYWYRRAAEQGHLNSQFNLGVMYAKGRGVAQDYEQAFHWYRTAAERGDDAAQIMIALMCARGIGTARDDAAASRWYREAADQGNASAQYNLASRCEQGLGTPKSLQEAFQWYLKAAEQGHLNAAVAVAYRYAKGLGVKRDDTKAREWYFKAAEQGHPTAQYNLGVIYAKGRGVEKNLEEARKWYRRAADQGDQNAAKELGRVEISDS
jgi:TPR repeat protein